MTKEELRELRKRLGYTQTEMAARLGMSIRSVQELESGRSLLVTRHQNAAHYLSMEEALARKDPTLLTEEAKTVALKILELTDADSPE